MIVVSDTSPLLYLRLVNAEHVLPALFGEVIVPPEVLEELGHPNSPVVIRDWTTDLPSWLIRQSPLAVDPSLDVDRGEAAAISLALELKADALLVDDRKARTAAAGRGIATVGTLTVLETAADRGLINLPQVIAALRETNFRISPRMLDKALARDQKRRGG